MAGGTPTTRSNATPPYQPLHPERHEIRLIEFVAPGAFDGIDTESVIEVACTVNAHSLDDYSDAYLQFADQEEDCPVRYQWGDYLAMSHTWGDRSQGEHILVNGAVIEVSRNLAEGLRAISRHPGVEKGHLKVWNDVLCLDQHNQIEVQREMKRMSTIFSNAYSVIAWVGPARDESHVVIDMLERLSDFHAGFATSGKTLKSIPKTVWKAFAHFLQRPFWRRMWIVQELILAGSRTVILCGSEQARLHSLWRLVADIIRNAPACHRLFEAAFGDSNSYYNQFRHETFAVCSRLYCLHEIDMSIQKGTSYDISLLLDVCRTSLQQDARDKVYGILGLLPSNLSALIEPDLDKTVHEVYKDLAKATFSATKRLDMLQDCRLDPERPKFPTWVPDLQAEVMSQTSDTRAITNAGGDLDIEPRLSPDELFLICRGFLLDVVDQLTPPQWPLVPVSEEEASDTISAVSRSVQNKNSVQDSLWRTFVSVSTVGSSHFPAPSEFSQLLDLPWPDSKDFNADVHNMAQGLINQNWCTPDSLQDLITFLLFRDRAGPQFDVCGYPLRSFFSSPYRQDSISSRPMSGPTRPMETALRRASHTLKYRRLIVTAQGRLGVATPETRRGDRIAVLRGCSVPIILRPASASSSSGSHQQRDTAFMVVGASYVHGVMGGETVHGQAIEEDFVLC